MPSQATPWTVYVAFIATWICSTTQPVKSTGPVRLTVEPVADEAVFEHVGAVWPSAEWRHIAVSMRRTVLAARLQKVARQATRLNMTALLQRVWWAEDQLRRDFALFEAQPVDRMARDVLGVLGGIVGVFNMWSSHRIEARVDANRQALRTTVLQVENVRKYIEEERGQLDALLAAARHTTLESQKNTLLAEWEDVAAHLGWMTDLAADLARGHAGTGLLHAVRMSQEWPRVVAAVHAQGMEPVFPHVHALAACPTTFWMEQQVLKVFIHVPVIGRGLHPFRLFRPLSRPISHGGALFTVAGLDNLRMAVSNDNRTFWEVTTGDLAECLTFGSVHVCLGRAVSLTGPQGTCMAALWAGLMPTILRRCALHALPPDFGAWPLGSNRIAIWAPAPRHLLARCRTGQTMRETIHGYVLVSLPEGCDAISDDWILKGGHTDHGRVLVTVSVNSSEWGSVLPLDGQGNVNVTWPQPVASMVEAINRQLEDSEQSLGLWTVLAISLSVIAVSITVLFLIYVYVRFRMAAPATPPPAQEPV